MEEYIECRKEDNYCELNFKDNTLFIISIPFPKTLPKLEVRTFHRLKRHYLYFYSLLDRYKMTGDMNYTQVEEVQSNWIKLDLITSLRYCLMYLMHYLLGNKNE